MATMQELFAQRFGTALGRKSVMDASRWATKYRYMGKPFPGLYTFNRHPWAKAMHDSKHVSNVGQKSAQMGFTEVALNVTFFYIDVKKTSVLYILPNTKPDASDFSSSRFDPALELSVHLQDLFSNVQNVGHKRAGGANLFIRGSNSRSQLKSLPVGLIVFDELEEMTQENIPLAMERMSGQDSRYDWKISTPCVPRDGINQYFIDSTQDMFNFPCPSCSRHITLAFDPDGKEQNNLIITGENLHDPKVMESHLICHQCKNKLSHEGKMDYEAKGIWVPTYEGRDSRGFYINQLYGMNEPQHPVVLAKAYLASIGDIAAEQEFWNSKMGLPKVPKDAQLTDTHVDSTIGTHRMLSERNTDNIITMGVDIGKVLHVWINDWKLGPRVGNDVSTYSKPINIYHGTVYDFQDLDKMMDDFGINFCVTDASPETRLARQFANRYYGRVRLCRYTENAFGKELVKSAEEELTINADRTSWLDLTLGRFRNKTITMPSNTTYDCRNQMKVQVRVTKPDRRGNMVSRYTTPKNLPDHFAHAANYAEIALPLALGIGISETIRE